MNAQTTIEATTLPAVPNNAANAVVLFDADKFDAFLAKLKADVDATPVDLTTKKGRDAIASVAAKVRSQKAGIDKDRLRLTKEWRDMTAQVNGAWNEIKERMDALAVEARKPLTEWEEAEQARIIECDAIIDKLALDGVVTIDDTAETVRARGKAVWAVEIDADRFGDKFEQATRAKEHAVDMLKTSLARLTREEAERAELEKLRAESAERDRVEADRIAAERERTEREAAARAAEERRIEAEKAEAERIERVRQDAADAARKEAEAAACKEREEAERAKQAEVDAANERARQAESARQKVEQQREWSQKIIQYCREVSNGFIGGQPQPFGILEHELATKVTVTTDEFGDFAPDVEHARAEALSRLREIKRTGDERREREGREADQAHRTAVKSAAKAAIMTCGVDEDAARKIVTLIIAGEIPAVSLRF